MLFTRLATLVAWLAVILGAFRVGVAIMAASISDPAERAALVSRYLGGNTPGHYIDQGFYSVIFGILLGAVLEHFKRTIPKT